MQTNKVYLVTRDTPGNRVNLSAYRILSEHPKTYKVELIGDLIGYNGNKQSLPKTEEEGVFTEFSFAASYAAGLFSRQQYKIKEEQAEHDKGVETLKALMKQYHEQKEKQ